MEYKNFKLTTKQNKMTNKDFISVIIIMFSVFAMFILDLI